MDFISVEVIYKEKSFQVVYSKKRLSEDGRYKHRIFLVNNNLEGEELVCLEEEPEQSFSFIWASQERISETGILQVKVDDIQKNTGGNSRIYPFRLSRLRKKQKELKSEISSRENKFKLGGEYAKQNYSRFL